MYIDTIANIISGINGPDMNEIGKLLTKKDIIDFIRVFFNLNI